jgi:hypothetical protein
MAQVTTQQLAQLMLGIARSQLAVVDSIENMKAGFKFTHVRPTLETASRIRSNHAETLADFPARLLLQMLGRNAPDLERVARELEHLISGESTTPSREALAEETAPRAADSLDMT